MFRLPIPSQCLPPLLLAIPTNSNATIQLIVAIVSSGSACVTCASSMYTLTYNQVTTEFQISREVATLGLSLFVIGLGLGPMILGPLSEFYGRRPIYIISFGFFLIWLIPCAVAKNVGTELVSRFVDGFAGSAFLSVAGGTVGDSKSRFWSSFILRRLPWGSQPVARLGLCSSRGMLTRNLFSVYAEGIASSHDDLYSLPIHRSARGTPHRRLHQSVH